MTLPPSTDRCLATASWPRTALFLIAWWASATAAMAAEPASPPAAPPTCVGAWISEERDVIIEIIPEDTGISGRIIAITAEEATVLDVKNPDPALRNRTILGHTFLRFTHLQAESGIWDAGSLYDSESGDTYTKVTLGVRNGTLVLTVSAMGGLWTEKVAFTAVDPLQSRQSPSSGPALVYLIPPAESAVTPRRY